MVRDLQRSEIAGKGYTCVSIMPAALGELNHFCKKKATAWCRHHAMAFVQCICIRSKVSFQGSQTQVLDVPH